MRPMSVIVEWVTGIKNLLINLRWHLYDKWRATKWEKMERETRINDRLLAEWEQYQADRRNYRRKQLEEQGLDELGRPIVTQEEINRLADRGISFAHLDQRRILITEAKLKFGFGFRQEMDLLEMSDAQLREEIAKMHQRRSRRLRKRQEWREEEEHRAAREHEARKRILAEEQKRILARKNVAKKAAKKAVATRKRDAAGKFTAVSLEAAEAEGEDSIQQQEREVSNGEDELPRCYRCGDSDDVSQSGGDNYWCSHCDHHIDSDGICYSPDCDTCQEAYEEAIENSNIRDALKFDRSNLEDDVDDYDDEEEEDDMDMLGCFNVPADEETTCPWCNDEDLGLGADGGCGCGWED